MRNEFQRRTVECTWECTQCDEKGKKWYTSLNARRYAKQHYVKNHPELIYEHQILGSALPIIKRRKIDEKRIEIP
jgi:hypothetical protein